MNETLQTIAKRKSIRKYQPTPMPQEHLNLILEAARQAPTGNNQQNWQIIVIRDAEMRKKTAQACENQMWMADAPVILCLVTLPGEGQVDGAIVLDHAILAAASLGYGTCWIGAYNPAEVKRVLGIPAEYGVLNLTPIGLPAVDPVKPARKAPGKLFMAERFGNPLDY
jgi:nitroreductase